MYVEREREREREFVCVYERERDRVVGDERFVLVLLTED
jgi:hypothetical protein